MISKLSELRVIAFSQCSQKNEKTIVTFWMMSTKNLYLTE